MEETKMDRLKGHLIRNKRKYITGAVIGTASVVVPTVMVTLVKEAYTQGKDDTIKALSATIVESYSDGYNAAYEELTSSSATDDALDLIKESFKAAIDADPDNILNT